MIIAFGLLTGAIVINTIVIVFEGRAGRREIEDLKALAKVLNND